ncbi:hypothetical protein K474DRAFT_1368380 [Panus rudis PR-1116 ss-1]|nr:hypothetical protein K474DRAFT_1368380 [Panus rudis PR-1116 ss-1]
MSEIYPTPHQEPLPAENRNQGSLSISTANVDHVSSPVDDTNPIFSPAEKPSHEPSGPGANSLKPHDVIESLTKFYIQLNKLQTLTKQMNGLSASLIRRNCRGLSETLLNLEAVLHDNAALFEPSGILPRDLNIVCDADEDPASFRNGPHGLDSLPTVLKRLNYYLEELSANLRDWPYFTSEDLKAVVSYGATRCLDFSSSLDALHEISNPPSGFISEYSLRVTVWISEDFEQIAEKLHASMIEGYVSIRNSERHASTMMAGLSAVAGLFAATAATTLQLSFQIEQRESSLMLDLTNLFWFISLFLSVDVALLVLFVLLWNWLRTSACTLGDFGHMLLDWPGSLRIFIQSVRFRR